MFAALKSNYGDVMLYNLRRLVCMFYNLSFGFLNLIVHLQCQVRAVSVYLVFSSVKVTLHKNKVAWAGRKPELPQLGRHPCVYSRLNDPQLTNERLFYTHKR